MRRLCYSKFRFALAAIGLAASFPTLAGAEEAGKTAGAVAGFEKAAICASCHGPFGISPVPTYPNIAGQNSLYIEYALRRYRAGERGGDQAGMMYTVTQALSDNDIADLAVYYAGLPAIR